jgi:hypothetical protein
MTSYQFSNQAWQVGRWSELEADVAGITVEELPLFHAKLASEPRLWLIARRLWGIIPEGFSLDADPEDLRPWTRTELQEKLGLTRAQLQSEVEAIRGHYLSAKLRVRPPELDPVAPPLPATELKLEDPQRLLARHGLDNANAGTMREWLLDRVDQMRGVLEKPNLSIFARELILTELALKKLVPGDNDKEYTQKRMRLLEMYQQQLTQLNDLAPWASSIAGGVQLAAALAEVTKALQEWAVSGTHTIADGIFTAMEVKVELRTSQQAPTPRYRAGLVAYLNYARENLFNPRFSNPFKAHELRRLDAGFQGAVLASHESSGAPAPPDLQAEGAPAEYEELAEAGNDKLSDGTNNQKP